MTELTRAKILFVDDEVHVLDGLRDSLHKARSTWDMFFEPDSRVALNRVAVETFDVVVSDMRMPGVDGVALLNRVRETQPNAVRIVLSGFAELEIALRAVTVAHQFLTKPCEADHIREVVRRACAIRDLLKSESLRKLVGSLDRLPSSPEVFAKVTQVMSDPKADVMSVASVIEQDPAMAAKLLQLANSGFFRLASPVTSVQSAVVHLGYMITRSLVLTSEVFAMKMKKRDQARVRTLQQHSQAVAQIALTIAPDKRTREDALMAALLHDVGQIVLLASFADYDSKVLSLASSKEEQLSLESTFFGVTHAEVGAYLLGLWGVPFSIVEAVAYHHQIDSPSTGLDPLSCVQLANELVHEGPTDSPRVSELAARVGATSRLPEWRAAVRARVP
jgi:putative nucleotidyltransferase with HDIG domain